MGNRPRIGITMRLEMGTRRFYLGRDYSEAIEAAGGIPVHISLIPNAEYIREVVSGLDGVLLPGSDTDVDPILYGEEPHPKLRTVIPDKDNTDQMVLTAAEELNVPLFGICYGMQALNVSRGGTLIQDIASHVDGHLKHDQGEPYDRASHGLIVGKDSLLAGLPSVDPSTLAVRVNSSHHQAIGSVGRDLKVSGWTSDGVVECVEDTRHERFALGVQWHPEITFRNDAFSREIFHMFIRRCSGSE